MDRHNVFTEGLGIVYPIIQAPMLGVTSPEMVAAVANEGGLGSLPVGGLAPDVAIKLIRQTKALTDKPFAVNLFTHDIPDVDVQQAERMQAFLIEIAGKEGIELKKEPVDGYKWYTYRDHIQLLLDEGIKIVSFTFGALDEASIRLLHDNDMVLIGTATCLQEAILLDELDIDMICAQGIEAGGHRGTFLKDIPLPMVGTFALVPQIVNRISKPVIAAGGIYDGDTMTAAFALGASAVQPGTAFVACDESLAIPSYKEALQHATDTDVVLTRAFSGRWARGINNRFMELVERSGLEIPTYPVQNSLTGLLRKMAQQNDNKNFTNIWAGQAANKAQQKPAAAIFRELVAQMDMPEI